MNKIIMCGAALALAAPVAAAADKPDTPKPGKSDCQPKAVGYSASGTYVSGTLTQTQGADTAARGDDRFSGDLVVTLKKTGEETVTLTDARVKFHPRQDTDLTAGDRVKLHGKVTRLGKKCDATGFAPTVTVRKVDIKAKRA